MIKIGRLEVNKKFFYWLVFINIVLFLITILQWNSKSELSITWHIFVYPLWIGFFSILIAFHFHIVNRGWYLYLPTFFLGFIVSYYMVYHHILRLLPENYQVTLNDYSTLLGGVFPTFVIGLMIGGTLGFLTSLFLTLPNRPPKHEIKKNIISFELKSEGDKEKYALTRLIGSYIRKDLNYYRLRSIDKNTVVYRTNKITTLKFILVSVNNNNISFFPFIKDGYKYTPNSDIIPYIKAIGNNIFGLKEISDNSIVPKFIDYVEPHKMLTLIKSLKGKRLSKSEKICLSVLSIFVISMILIFVLPSYELKFSFSLSLISVIVTLISIIVGITGIVIAIIMYRKFKGKK